MTQSLIAEDCSGQVKALTLCNQYVKALEEDNDLLHQKVAALNSENNALIGQVKKDDGTAGFPAWGYFIIGAVASGLIVYGATK